MALRCESCGVLNPAINRFCGQCGIKLEQTAIAPEEFGRESRAENPAGHVEVSADLPPEVIDFDNQIPLIASEGADRPHPLSPELAELAHDHLNREAELHDHLQHGGETHLDALAKKLRKKEAERASRMEILRWKEAELESRGVTMPWKFDNEVGVSASSGESVTDDVETAEAIMDAAASANQPDQPSEDWNIGAGEKSEENIEEKESVHAGLSNLSILGLDDDHVEYADEEPEAEESHSRRNLVLAVVAVTVILLGWQWRSIRDYGVASVRNGSAYLRNGWTQAENGLANAQDGLISAWYSWRQPKPSEQPIASAPPAVAENTSAPPIVADSTSAPSAIAESIPSPLSAPLPPRPSGARRAIGSSSKVSHKLPARQTARSSRSRWAKASSAAPSTTRHQPAAMSASAAMPEKTPAVAFDRTVASSGTASTPGAEEMNRATHASAPELRAVWLWRALAKGNPEAPVELAMIYEQGSGVARSCDQARVLLRSAAAKGNEQAKQDLQQLQRRGGCASR